MARQASLLVADEIYYNLYGKAILQGIYSGDLTIPVDPSASPQLIFYFMMEADIAEPFKSLAVEVTLPGNQPIRNFVPVMPPEFIKSVSAGRTRAYYRHPLLLQAPVLHPGKIEAKIIHESGEIEVIAPWIALNPALATPPKPS
jgi:hypothetical protein